MHYVVRKIKRHLQTQEPLLLDGMLLQTWWKIYRREESPESDKWFSEVVGVVREKIVLPHERAYQQKPVAVFTKSLRSRKGAAIASYSDGGIFVTDIALQTVDWNYTIFDD